ncbi:glycosyltransferase WbpY [Pseudomonas sp. ATCC 13867]|uniref:glycosyltransferase family 4 protein n=1 Tax=Pseudomonas sp. ATCC 13867 TaxID=1294143 RepID=UPI0002C4E519|nr:glycosyltransferase family 1 protein [Pseudomonas sp. ATCC 13867]AGI22003.1 glycosyltransferase WbpY [Pseudomonas sp. ATCC 13867]RFQ25236.1 glycosyltransferase family 1 protein [Pseudomonas sp. ATCC 13867]
MRIALNARILQAPRTGIGQYVAALAMALGETPGLQLELFLGWTWSARLPEAALPGYSRWADAAKRVPGAYRIRRWLEQSAFDKGLTPRGVELYHEPTLWPLEFEGPMVMTLHDLTHVHYPQTQPRDRLAEIERRVGKGVERSRCVLTDSQHVAEEIRRHFALPADRVTVAPLGCAPRFHPRSAEAIAAPLQPLELVPGQYLICVGTLEPRKNLTLALKAYALLPERVRAHLPLVIVGMPGWRDETLNETLRKAVASGQVRLLGYQSDESLARLLAGARALLFPSLYEGFGLPVLEAMASGVPVVLTRTSSLPEVAGEAGVYVNAEDPQEMSIAIQRLVDDESFWQRCRALGLERAGAFSWQRCARITSDVYRKVLEG